MKATCPVVYGGALLSARSAKFSSSVLKMPQTKKSRITPGSVQSGATAEDAEQVSREECQAAGDGGGGEDNVGDSEIIKSPSDPKQYR